MLLLRGVCNFLGSVLPQQKFEVTDGPVLQLSFIGKKGKYLLEARGRVWAGPWLVLTPVPGPPFVVVSWAFPFFVF